MVEKLQSTFEEPTRAGGRSSLVDQVANTDGLVYLSLVGKQDIRRSDREIDLKATTSVVAPEWHSCQDRDPTQRLHKR